MRIAILAAAVALVLAAAGAAPAAADSPIAYTTLFQDPGADPHPDFSLERHAIELIDATPAGERISFAFRDFNRDPVADALIRARERGVIVDGVIDGGERFRLVVQRLQAALGADHFVICGSPTFEFNSCIANSITPSLQHNKFLVFSKLADGREPVVLETSENFLEPTQFNYYNDMVEIDGDHELYAAYVQYVADMKAQVRSDDHYLTPEGDDRRNQIFLSPRRQASVDTDDTIVDQMDDIDCSQGGSATGHGLVRIANMAFRSERAVIMRKLIELHDAGCEIDVILSNADGDILAGLVSAGIPVHPFFLRSTTTRPQVMVHDKFWIVDARSKDAGVRRKTVYAGSSNWRPDEQYSDDLLLKIVDDGVFDAFDRYWELIRSRAASDQTRRVETVAPSSALRVTPAPNAAGWNRSAVTVRIAASDGHNVGAGGLRRLHVEMTGEQIGSWDFLGEHDGYTVQELPISAEGETTVTYFAEDANGNREAPRTATVHVDRTPPAVTGLPTDCEIWPPNGRMVHVADIAADDLGSGVADLAVSASSDDADDDGDVSIDGGSVDVRAEKAARGRTRTYVITAVATDLAGNRTEASGACVVPRSPSS
jgi:hypothetical protein